MEYRNVVTFLRLTEQLSFVRTAELLGYSQGTITVQIKQLEEELGTKLFDRYDKRVRLTSAGEAFIPYAQQLVQAHENAQNYLKDQDVPPGSLYIDASSSISSIKMPKLLSAFNEAYPQIDIHFRTTDYMIDEMEKLEKNEIDFLYLVDKPFIRTNFISAAVKEEPIVFVAHKSHPLAKEKKITVEQLISQNFIVTNREISYCHYLDLYLAEKGLSLNTPLEISAVDVIVRLLLQNVGISYLPYFTVEQEVANQDLVILPVDYPQDSIYSQLLYHKNKWMSPQIKAFLDFAERMK